MIVEHRLCAAAVVVLASSCARDLHVEVVSQEGTPASGVQLQVDDGDWIAPDAEGKATFRGVGPSFILRVYQVTAGAGSPRSPSWRHDTVRALQDPEGDPVVVTAYSYIPPHPPTNEASISGTVTGESGGQVWLYYGGEPAQNVDPGGSFSIALGWERPDSITHVVRAIESDGARPPGHYLGYGESASAVTVTGGANITGVLVPLEPVSEAAVSPAVTWPAALAGAQQWAELSLRFADGDQRSLGWGPVGDPVSVVVPQVSGAEAWLAIHAGQAGYALQSVLERRVPMPAVDVPFDLSDPVDLVEPVAGQSIDMGTVFRWSGGPGGGRTGLVVECLWMEPGVSRQVMYDGLEGADSLPAVDGIAVPSGALCGWQVTWRSLPAETGPDERRYTASEWRGATFQ